MKALQKLKPIKSGMSVIIISLSVLIGLTVVALIMANRQMETVLGGKLSNYPVYRRHYALILHDTDEDFETEIYRGCLAEGQRQDAFVEWFGNGLEEEYSGAELVNMAEESGVDGIIVRAEETKEFEEAIADAWKNNIPVITVIGDCMESARKSFVGIGGYDLGREYARQIIKEATKENRKVLVLLDADADDSTQNIICNGIRETINNEGNHLRMEIEMRAVDSTSSFSADESIRRILTELKTLPDFLVCLSEQNTNIVNQALVDYNIVGEISVLGYYTSPTILQAIEKGILSSTIAIDYADMGKKCAEALTEYYETGNVSGYFWVDAYTVNSSNIKEYLRNDTGNQR